MAGVHGTLKPIRIVDLPQGITAIFEDGAVITLTMEGVSECARCFVTGCRHWRAAMPSYERRKWEIAEAMREKWGPGKYRALNLDPRLFFRPSEMEYDPAIDWDGLAGQSEMVILEMAGGYLATFRDGGHIWISPDHPEGATRCLQCHVRDCRHCRMAMREIEKRLNAKAPRRQDVKMVEGGG